MNVEELPPELRKLVPHWKPLRYHEQQQAFTHAATVERVRFIQLVCGRRSGKTELVKRRLALATLEDRGHGDIHEYRVGAPTLDQARNEIKYWPHLKDLIGDLQSVLQELGEPYYIEDINESRSSITTRFGTIRTHIRVIGFLEGQRKEGSALDGLVIDEASDVPPGVFTGLLPNLLDRDGWCYRIGIPKSSGDGAVEYRAACERGFSGDDPDHRSFTWPSWDILTPRQIALAKENLTEDEYNERFGAAWGNKGRGPFYAFDAEVHVKPCEYRPDLPILVGLDFNTNPMSWVLATRRGGVVFGSTEEVYDVCILGLDCDAISGLTQLHGISFASGNISKVKIRDANLTGQVTAPISTDGSATVTDKDFLDILPATEVLGDVTVTTEAYSSSDSSREHSKPRVTAIFALGLVLASSMTESSMCATFT